MFRILIILLIVSSCTKNQVEETSVNAKVKISDCVNIEITVNNFQSDTAYYQFPKTIPGIYSQIKLGDNNSVYDFKVIGLKNEKLVYKKIDNYKYEIYSTTTSFKITYKLPLSYSLSESLAYGVVKLNDLIIINNNTIFGYFNKFQDLKFDIELEKPKNLSCISPTQSTLINDTTLKFKFNSYYDLVQSPIVLSKWLDTCTFLIDSTKITISTYAPLKLISSKDLYRILKPTIETCFSSLPVKPKRYNLVYIFNNRVSRGSKVALERNNSSIYIYPREFKVNDSLDSYKLMNDLKKTTAHEIMHLFTPLNFKDESISPFKFDKLELSEHLWLFEGFTEYISNKILVKNKIISRKTYFNDLALKIRNYKRDKNYDLLKSSKNIYKTTRGLQAFYNKGALFNFILDLSILQNSKGSLDLYQVLKQIYLESPNINSGKILSKIIELTNSNIKDIIDLSLLKEPNLLNIDKYLLKVNLKYIRSKKLKIIFNINSIYQNYEGDLVKIAVPKNIFGSDNIYVSEINSNKIDSYNYFRGMFDRTEFSRDIQIKYKIKIDSKFIEKIVKTRKRAISSKPILMEINEKKTDSQIKLWDNLF